MGYGTYPRDGKATWGHWLVDVEGTPSSAPREVTSLCGYVYWSPYYSKYVGEPGGVSCVVCNDLLDLQRLSTLNI